MEFRRAPARQSGRISLAEWNYKRSSVQRIIGAAQSLGDRAAYRLLQASYLVTQSGTADDVSIDGRVRRREDGSYEPDDCD